MNPSLGSGSRGVAATLGLVLWLAGANASAAILTVTIEDDVVADDGACSLREAIGAVNDLAPSGALPGECPAGDGLDTILLAAGTYRTTIGPAGEDDNDGGDLDIARSMTIEGAGPATEVQNGLGSPSVAGDGDRLFHIDPAGAGDVDVVFRGLALMDGEAFCNSAGCATGAGAIEASNARHLTVEDCVFEKNSTSCSGTDCGRGAGGSAAAIVHGAAGDLTIARTTFSRNTSSCSGTHCRSGHVAFVQVDPLASATATVDVSDTTLTKNSGSCVSADCSVQDLVAIDAGSVLVNGVSVTKNSSSCEGSGCTVGTVFEIDAATTNLSAVSLLSNRRSAKGDSSVVLSMLSVDGGSLTSTALTLKSDRSTCRGTGCNVRELLDADVDVADFDGLVAEACRGDCRGAGCEVEERLYIARSAGSSSVRNASIVKNQSKCREDGCQANAVLFLRGVELELADSQVASNKVSCKGPSCFLTPVVAFYPSSDTVQSVVDTVEILSNKCSCKADDCSVLAPACGLFVVSNVAPGVLVSGATISKNKGDTVGGGVGSLAPLLLENSEISRNRSTRGGGGIYNGGELSISDSSIVDNTAKVGRASTTDYGALSPVCGDGSRGCGGGILNQGTIASISASTIAGNRPEDCLDDGGSGCP